MRIGILGTGQLGRMLAQAAIKRGHTIAFYDSSHGSPTEEFQVTTVAPFDDRNALEAFAGKCDIITYEFENIPSESVRILERYTDVYPPRRALEISQDRLHEKEFLQSLTISTPRFKSASSQEELFTACHSIGFPCIVKTRRFGYDGKGQVRVSDASEVASAWKQLQPSPLIIEGFVPFSRELSIIGTRDRYGNVVTYPLIQNTHINGILHRSEIPAPAISTGLQAHARELIKSVLHALSYVGTLTIELFDVRGEILVNEIAPRVHNSGHATIESFVTSQFENHILAIVGDPLGASTPCARAVMYNIIGEIPDLTASVNVSSIRTHLYNKTPRAGRKLGHITLLNPSEAEERLISQICHPK